VDVSWLSYGVELAGTVARIAHGQSRRFLPDGIVPSEGIATRPLSFWNS
jgi:hypothetical protein